MLAVDKAEDLLAEYFKKYGLYTLGGTPTEKLELTLLHREMDNVCRLYQSHRLYVYQHSMSIFHRLFVEDEIESNQDDMEPIEDILANVEKIFLQYSLDSIYYHLKLVFEFLKLEYYTHYKVYKKAEKYFDEVNDAVSTLLTNYSLYTYPSQFLFTKVNRHMRSDTEHLMYEENDGLFQDFEIDTNDLPKYISYVTYRALSCYYANKYDEASKWINNLLNDLSLKRFPQAQLEVKLLLALQYCLLNDYELFSQLLNSIQRQIRILGKDNCERMLLFTKILKTSLYDSKNGKAAKIRSLVEKLAKTHEKGFSITNYIKMDEGFINRLTS
jgi:tetratricopeptide (TPR) repeat protein